jgi:hypothetical protein
MYRMPINSNEDEIMKIDDFISCCRDGFFTDYDGFGYPVKGTLANRHMRIYPSNLSIIPSDATHIVWYNK